MNPLDLSAPPFAGPMMEALRGVGYSLPAAIADIIDNSISAQATEIRVSFNWAGPKSSISILDDGTGMTDAELIEAMRLGSRSPSADRSPYDLGRFGLGLKTASFSQCRRLTVASIKAGIRSVRRWDLDYLCSTNEWHLLEGPHPGSEGLLEPMRAYHQGTLVLWEELDRFPEALEPLSVEPSIAFLGLIKDTERHQSMIFHRFLEGRSQIAIRLNGRPLRAWDPFLRTHHGTIPSPPEKLSSGQVFVQGFVLPNREHLSATEYEEGGGPEGWIVHQGFFVYRNRRLLVPGSWLGLGQGRTWPKEESYKLARLQLDFSNQQDNQWEIDVRKSRARPPQQLHKRLRELADQVRRPAKQVLTQRSSSNSRSAQSAVDRVWEARPSSRGPKYLINRRHAAVDSVAAHLPETRDLEALLHLIEETVPVQRIWIEASESPESIPLPLSSDTPEGLRELVKGMMHYLTERAGLSQSSARERLLRTEPFNLHIAHVERILDHED